MPFPRNETSVKALMGMINTNGEHESALYALNVYSIALRTEPFSLS